MKQQNGEKKNQLKPKVDSGAVDRNGEASAAASVVVAPPAAGGGLQPTGDGQQEDPGPGDHAGGGQP